MDTMQQDDYERLCNEFDRQIENLVNKGYPETIGVAVEEFTRQIQPLKAQIAGLVTGEAGASEGRIPFVIVISNDMLAGDQAMSRVELKGNSGCTVMEPDDIKKFRPIESVSIPAHLAYLLVDIDTGKETLNITPNEALKIIEAGNRSPLTIDEGIAIVTHHPDILKRNNCFSLLGSRCGDRRVTALWISAGKPKLGWCWAGNPHTWLGSASCERRVGP